MRLWLIPEWFTIGGFATGWENSSIIVTCRALAM
jgi:hypothetical protein